MQDITFLLIGLGRTCRKSQDDMEVALLDFQIKEILHSVKLMATIVIILLAFVFSLWASYFYFEKDPTLEKKEKSESVFCEACECDPCDCGFGNY
jgi:hypothetical protein